MKNLVMDGAVYSSVSAACDHFGVSYLTVKHLYNSHRKWSVKECINYAREKQKYICQDYVYDKDSQAVATKKYFDESQKYAHNRYKRWTEYEDNLIMTSGLSVSELGKLLGRSIPSIACRKRDLKKDVASKEHAYYHTAKSVEEIKSALMYTYNRGINALDEFQGVLESLKDMYIELTMSEDEGGKL